MTKTTEQNQSGRSGAARGQIQWNASRKDSALISKIVARAISLTDLDRLEVAMDLTAVHLNDCPLDLERMLAAPDVHFLHDIYGINRHLNRRTAQLANHFLPRLAARALLAQGDR